MAELWNGKFGGGAYLVLGAIKETKKISSSPGWRLDYGGAIFTSFTVVQAPKSPSILSGSTFVKF